MSARGVVVTARLALVLATLSLGACGGEEDPQGSPGAETTAPEPGSITLSDLERCGRLPVKAKFRCGSLDVPFERSDDSYGTTRIGFAVLTRRDRSRPSQGAIFAVEGGPGYASTGTGRSFATLLRPLLERRELVLVDQRGQGTSERYDCPDVQSGLGPQFVTLAACARRLGKRFISYRTSAAADDIDAVREALGYERITLYGDSYGTFLGQSYAYRHGDRLEALVLDSAYPAFGEDPWYPSLPRTGIRALGIACDRAPSCHGDAIERLGQGVRLLRDQGRPVTDLITTLIDAAYGPPRTYLMIDRALRDLLAGDARKYNDVVGPDRRVAFRHPQRFQAAGEFVVGCNDYPMIWDRTASEPERRDQLEQAIRDYPSDAFEPFTTREIAYSPGTAYLECLTWPAPTDVYEPAVDPEAQAPTEAPVLVVNGELDDVTTPIEGRTVAGFFPDSEFLLARNAGHVDPLYDATGPAGRKVREFLTRELPVNR